MRFLTLRVRNCSGEKTCGYRPAPGVCRATAGAGSGGEAGHAARASAVERPAATRAPSTSRRRLRVIMGSPPSERFEKLDERALVLIGQIGAEQMPPVEHEIG